MIVDINGAKIPKTSIVAILLVVNPGIPVSNSIVTKFENWLFEKKKIFIGVPERAMYTFDPNDPVAYFQTHKDYKVIYRPGGNEYCISYTSDLYIDMVQNGDPFRETQRENVLQEFFHEISLDTNIGWTLYWLAKEFYHNNPCYEINQG